MSRPINPRLISFAQIDRLLRGRSDRESATTATFTHILQILIAAGCWYGTIMGAFYRSSLPRPAQIAFSATKMPLLLLATFWLTVPSFFVINTLLGLRADFAQSLKKLIAAQAILTIVLASLSPLTAFWYVCVPDYQDAILFNAAMLTIASISAQWSLRREYRPLITRNPRHRWTLRAWLLIYAFVGIQMGWILRPFIGDPTLPTTFFRKNAFTNAYTVVAQLLLEKLRHLEK